MGFAEEYPSLNFVLDEILESIGDIKLALKDGHVTVDEIVSAIPDEGVRAYFRKLLTALTKLPGEVEAVVSGGPWKMMGVFQALASKAMSIFK